MCHLNEKPAVLKMLVVDDLIHGPDGPPRQTQLLSAMPGFLQRNAGEKGFERCSDMRHAGLNGGWTLVFFIQEILRQASAILSRVANE